MLYLLEGQYVFLCYYYTKTINHKLNKLSKQNGEIVIYLRLCNITLN